MSALSDSDFQMHLLDLRPRLAKWAKKLGSKWSSNHQDEEDLVQEILATAWEARETYNPELGGMATWVNAIMRHRISNHLRLKGVNMEKAHTISLDDALDRIEHVGTDPPSLSASDKAIRYRFQTEPTQEHTVALNEVIERIKRLTPVQQQAMHMVGIEGYGWTEAAREIGISRAGVEQRLKAAWRMMKKDGYNAA